jgi:3'-phosphoadenosine 5'-phosphosulfate sulfotransferase (PAPS reductase)/FAD synthetase
VIEPALTAADRKCWDMWMRTCATHARTRAHAGRVAAARRIVARAFEQTPSWCVMISGGKDSTAMAGIVADVAPGTPAASEKDDMDYPGEEEYVSDLCARLGLPLTILRPPVSPREVIAREAATVGVDGDWHGRTAELSKLCFYEVVESHGALYDGVFLGLRSRESHGRRMNRAVHGVMYRKRPTIRHAEGQWVCAPLSDWHSIDVYAYALKRGLDLLPVYQCVAFMHRKDPGTIRKSWWLPNGRGVSHGDVAWLRRYYPSLYRQLVEWMPDAARNT